MNIRPATLADVPSLPALEKAAGEAFRGTPHAWIADDRVTEAGEYPPFIADDAVWVAEIGGALAGLLIAHEQGDAFYIAEVAVHGAHQKQGIGRALMAHAIAEARRRGLSAVTLTTFSNVAFNRPFYESLGFRVLPDPPPALQAHIDEENGRGLTHRVGMQLDL
jgi:GNAT superfamily N-acetyltransferase